MSVKGIATHLSEMHVILGPAPCQGCGHPVVYMRHGYARGWLHPNGNLRCPLRCALSPATIHRAGTSSISADTVADGRRGASPTLAAVVMRRD